MEAKFLSMIFLILSTQKVDARIWKRLTPPINANETNEINKNSTFHINVSAGYGVQQSQPQENSTTVRPQFVPSQSYQFRAGNYEILKESEKTNATKFAPSPAYQFIERNSPKTAETDNTQENPEPVNPPQELLTFRGNYYQVEEPISDSSNQENVFNLARTYQFQPSYLHSRNRPSIKDLHNVVNNVEYDYGLGAPKPAKIVEIVRVPAVYELHLQNDNQEEQRFISLNPWLSKLNGFSNNKPSSQMIRHQKPSYNGYYNHHQPTKVTPSHSYVNQYQNDVYSNQQNIPISSHQEYYQQSDNGNGFDSNYYQNQHQESEQQYHQHYQQQQQSEGPPLETILLMAQQLQRPNQHYQQYKSLPKPKQTYKPLQNYIRLPHPEGFKKIQEPATIFDYTNYKKPQAIHEVPAPVLHNPHQHPESMRIKTTDSSIPLQFYANQQQTIETIPSNLIYEAQQHQTVSGPLDNLMHLSPIQASDYYQNQNVVYKGQVESVPTDYGQYQNTEAYLESASNLIDSGGKIVNLPQQLIQIDNSNQKEIETQQYNNENVNGGNNYNIPQDLVNYLVPNLAKGTSPTYLQGEISSNDDVGVGNRQPQVFPMYQNNNQDNDGKINNESGEKSEGEEIFSQNISPNLNLMVVKTPQHQRHRYQNNRYQQSEENNNRRPLHFESMKIRNDMKTMTRPKPMNYPNRNSVRNNNNGVGNNNNVRSRRHGPRDYIIFIKERRTE